MVRKYKAHYVLTCMVLLVLSLAMLIPVANIIALSFTSPDKIPEVSGFTMLPKGFSLINYKLLLTNSKVLRALFNSLLITGVSTILNVYMTCISAYVLTQSDLKGKSILIGILILVMFFEPGVVQEYLVMKHMHLIGDYWSVILYKAINVYYLIIMMRFFEDIPKSLIDAARVDGAGHGKILLRIFIPLAKPAMVTVGLLYTVFHWNACFKPSIFLSQDKWPLQVLLRQFVVLGNASCIIEAETINKASQISYEALKAGFIVIAIVPILILYPLILKYYTKGTMQGGVKG